MTLHVTVFPDACVHLHFNGKWGGRGLGESGREARGEGGGGPMPKPGRRSRHVLSSDAFDLVIIRSNTDTNVFPVVLVPSFLSVLPFFLFSSFLHFFPSSFIPFFLSSFFAF